MPHPRVVITGVGVVSPFGVGRERFWQHISRGCSGTRAITDFDTTGFACRVAAPVTDVTFDQAPAVEGDDTHDREHRADPRRYSKAALVGVIAAREAGTCRAEGGARGRQRHHRQWRWRHRRRREAVRLLRRGGQEGHALRDSISIVGMMSSGCRFHCGCTESATCNVRRKAPPMPSATRPSSPDRRGRCSAVGRRACVTPGDVRVLADAVCRRYNDTGGGVAAVRSGA